MYLMRQFVGIVELSWILILEIEEQISSERHIVSLLFCSGYT